MKAYRGDIRRLFAYHADPGSPVSSRDYRGLVVILRLALADLLAVVDLARRRLAADFFLSAERVFVAPVVTVVE
jgi:hypothetical protein